MAALQEHLDHLVDLGLPGIALAVDRPGAEPIHLASGFADLRSGTPLEACHLTRAGSIDKTVTAVVVMQLAEEGTWDLDDLLVDHLPPGTAEGIPNADRATLRQALQHATGMPNWIQSLYFQTASLDDLGRQWSADQLLRFARHMRPVFSPGTDVGYSNTNTLLLGLAIEHRTGEPLADVFERRVFQPLALDRTRFAAPDPVPDDLVAGYVDIRSDGRLLDATHYNGWDVHADGGLLSHPGDLARLMRAANDGTLLDPDTTLAMHDVRSPAHVDPGFYETGYGLGVFRLQTAQGTWWMHSGDAIGYWATAAWREEDGLAVSWAVNGNYGQLDDLFASQEAYGVFFDAIGPPDP
ncbi:MAG: beta-lactamase family protein [Alphaproteobacteria bacterium]|nr:beta-lactamase family protein [Alphaproteobacteria bacterium]MCB9693458.1 beta-lactamase family protein [Alphaproteobacteria bacterium]